MTDTPKLKVKLLQTKTPKIKAKLRAVPGTIPVVDQRPLSLRKTPAQTKACSKGVYTITFGDVAENGIGMEQLGQVYGRGLTVAELLDTKTILDSQGYQTEWVDLTEALTDEDLEYLRGEGKPRAIKKKSLLPKSMRDKEVQAGFLIIRNGAQAFISDKDGVSAADQLKAEQQGIQYDTRKLSQYKQEVRSVARHNVCFDDFDQEINLSAGQGTVVNFRHLPLLTRVREGLKDYIPVLKEVPIKAEGNYYYDRGQCGIGWHGDKERRIVIAIRLGESMDINYGWWYGHQRVGERVTRVLNHGDMYIMSDKAVGYDTGSPSKLTLRHSAGVFSKRDF